LNVFFGAGYKARLVGIFDAEEKLPSHFFGKQVVVQGGAQSSDVECTGGGRGKSYANFSSHVGFGF
jgi:hypothetical protein